VARPRVPLISKRKALEVALDIIDSEGIAALSIRRLADRLHVNGASLYHHFANKEEIVLGAARLALDEVRVPGEDGQSWRVWILGNARGLRTVLRAHPDLVPVMLRRHPLTVGGDEMEETVVRLRLGNVPEGAIAPMLEALALYAISSALHETELPSAGEETRPGVPLDGATDQPEPTRTHSHLTSAITQRALSSDEVFDIVCEKIIDSTIVRTLERGGTVAPMILPQKVRERGFATDNRATA